MSASDPYLYPGLSILRNKLGIRSEPELDIMERQIVAQRSAQGIPSGNFDLAHLRSIHKHLFQDIYDWAGQIRTVELNKGGQQFQFRKYIETGMADTHRRLIAANFFKISTETPLPKKPPSSWATSIMCTLFVKETGARKCSIWTN